VGFLRRVLCAGYVDGGWALGTSFVNLEADDIANLKIIELHANYLLLVEEKILLPSFDGDESKLFVRKNGLDCSCHVFVLIFRATRRVPVYESIIYYRKYPVNTN